MPIAMHVARTFPRRAGSAQSREGRLHPRRWSRRVALFATTLLFACHAPGDPDSLAGPPSAASGKAGGKITVIAIDPNEVDQGTVAMDLLVSGTGFEAGSAVSFQLKGKTTKKLSTNSTTFVSATELIANVDVAIDAEAADYDVVVRKGPTKGVGSELLRVKLTGPVNPEEGLSVTFDGTQTGIAGDGRDADGDGAPDPYDHGVDRVEALILHGNGNFRLDPVVANQGPRCLTVRVLEDGDADGDGAAGELLFGPTCLDPDWMTTAPIFGGPIFRDIAADGIPRLVNGNLEFAASRKAIYRVRFGRDDCLGSEAAVANAAKMMTLARDDGGTPGDPDDDIWTLSGDRATFCHVELRGQTHRNIEPPVDVRVPFLMTIRKLAAGN